WSAAVTIADASSLSGLGTAIASTILTRADRRAGRFGALRPRRAGRNHTRRWDSLGTVARPSGLPEPDVTLQMHRNPRRRHPRPRPTLRSAGGPGVPNPAELPDLPVVPRPPGIDTPRRGPRLHGDVPRRPRPPGRRLR